MPPPMAGPCVEKRCVEGPGGVAARSGVRVAGASVSRAGMRARRARMRLRGGDHSSSSVIWMLEPWSSPEVMVPVRW